MSKAKRPKPQRVLKTDVPKIEVRGAAPIYLMDMQDKVLFGEAEGIINWCRKRDVAVPNLLDLERARHQRKRERVSK